MGLISLYSNKNKSFTRWQTRCIRSKSKYKRLFLSSLWCKIVNICCKWQKQKSLKDYGVNIEPSPWGGVGWGAYAFATKITNLFEYFHFLQHKILIASKAPTTVCLYPFYKLIHTTFPLSYVLRSPSFTLSFPLLLSSFWIHFLLPYPASKIPPIWLAEAPAWIASMYNTFTKFLNRRRKVGIRDIEATIPCSLSKRREGGGWGWGNKINCLVWRYIRKLWPRLFMF